jgi:hypothetical protein
VVKDIGALLDNKGGWLVMFPTVVVVVVVGVFKRRLHPV